MITIKSNIPYLEKKIDRLRKLTDKGWQKDAVSVMKQAAKMLSILTPRSKGNKTKWKKSGRSGGMTGTIMPHLADGWTTRTIGRGGKDRVPVITTVYNKFSTDSAGRRKKRAVVGEGGSGPYTVLDILEYGSRAHVITPNRASVLVFTTSTGEKVFTKRVDHPGTKAYGMIKLTRARLPALLKVVNIKWARKIEREWGKK